MTVKEIWYKIEGYDRYEVSNLGRVMDLEKAEFVKPKLVNNRHCFVSLYDNDGKLKMEKLSILVLRYVLKIRKSIYYVMYRDNNPYNCSEGNIYEIHHSYRGRKRLDQESVKQIYKLSKDMRPKEIAELYELPVSTIYSIKNKKSYKDITDVIDIQEAMKDGYIPSLLKF